MTKDELINEILYDFLWEIVSNKTEEIKNLTVMLKDIEYLDDKEALIAKTTKCEVQTTDDFDIINSRDEDDHIVLECEMDFIMQTFIGREYIWRITGITKCKIRIPGIEGYNWEKIKNTGSADDFLRHKDIVDFTDINFDGIECDCLYV